jgi:hypothetical protein
MVVLAIPVGGICGLLVADWFGRFILGYSDNSHGDAASVLGNDALGIFIGVLVVPCGVWYFTRQKRS